MVRPNVEFLDSGPAPWHKVSEGVYEKVLSRDEETRGYTRLVKFEPGSKISDILVHDFHEEFIVIDGSLVDETLGKKYVKGCYSFRNPGKKHGPFHSQDGCLAVEIRYYG